MSMFEWFRKKSKSARLKFLESLSERETPKFREESNFTGSRYEIILLYNNSHIKVTLEYSCIAKEYTIQIWSFEAETFLFYYDCLNNEKNPAKSVRSPGVRRTTPPRKISKPSTILSAGI